MMAAAQTRSLLLQSHQNTDSLFIRFPVLSLSHLVSPSTTFFDSMSCLVPYNTSYVHGLHTVQYTLSDACGETWEPRR
jgi:hypothetical protein